jgi:hypothetical protein
LIPGNAANFVMAPFMSQHSLLSHKSWNFTNMGDDGPPPMGYGLL